MGDYESLVEMGFDSRKVTLALKNTKGFNDAITWLADNEDISVEELEAKHGGGAAADSSKEDPLEDQGEGDGSPAVGPEAKSLKCSECGKLFNTPEKAQFHAHRT